MNEIRRKILFAQADNDQFTEEMLAYISDLRPSDLEFIDNIMCGVLEEYNQTGQLKEEDLIEYTILALAKYGLAIALQKHLERQDEITE